MLVYDSPFMEAEAVVGMAVHLEMCLAKRLPLSTRMDLPRRQGRASRRQRHRGAQRAMIGVGRWRML